MGVVVWLLERSRHPEIEVAHLVKEFPATEKLPANRWILRWQIFNRGGVTATGVDVDLEVQESSIEGSPTKRFKMFSRIDILPEKVRNDSPPTIAIGYEPPSAKFILFQPLSHTSMDSLEVKRGSAFAEFQAELSAPSEPTIPLGYTVEITLSGENLTDADRRARRYLIYAGHRRPADKAIPSITDLEPYL